MAHEQAPLPALVRLLWGEHPSRARLLPEHHATPPGHVVVDRLLVTPSLQRPRLLLPADASTVAQSTLLRAYNDVRYLGTRSMRAAILRALQVEPLTGLIGQRVNVVLPEEQAEATLRHLVARHLDVDPGGLLLSAALRETDGGLRPTVTVAADDGHPLLFVKVARRRIHTVRLGQEVAALTALRETPVDGLRTASPVFDVAWQGSRVLGVTALPTDDEAITVDDPGVTWPLLSDLQANQPMSLERLNESGWMRQLRARAEGAPEFIRGPLLSHFDRIARHYGHQYFAMGRTHGDWLPWNMARSRDGQLSVWDWEHSHPAAPLLLDPLHWHFGVATVLKGRSIPSGVAAVREQIRHLSAAPPGLAAIFLAEHAVRRAEEVRPDTLASREIAVRALRALSEAL